MRMTRTEIIEEAKQLVIGHGPSNCLEFTGEIVGNDIAALEASGRTVGRSELYAEVRKQAGRVYSFLGYINPVA